MKHNLFCALMVIGIGCSGEAKKPAAMPSNPSPAAAPASTTAPANVNAPAAATSATTPPEKPVPADGQRPSADLLEEAQKAFEAKDPDKGLAVLDELHKSAKSTVYSLVLAASFYDMRGRSTIMSDPKAAIGHFERAIDSYQKAEKTSPDGLIPFTKKQWGAATYDLGRGVPARLRQPGKIC
jgi:hypothetical protein